MTVTSHIVELKRKHQTLSDAVDAAQRTPSSNTLEIVALKKQKLALKEEIRRLQSH
ncbi:MAG: DUF465 domain-containing protein [Pseudomonadota bacterium]